MSMLLIFVSLLTAAAASSCSHMEPLPIFYTGTIANVHGTWAITIETSTNISLAEPIPLNVNPVGTIPDNFYFGRGTQFLPGTIPIVVPHPEYPPNSMYLNITSPCTAPQYLMVEVGEGQPECPSGFLVLVLQVVLCDASTNCGIPFNSSTIADNCSCTSLVSNATSVCNFPTSSPTVPATLSPTPSPTTPATVVPTPLPTSPTTSPTMSPTPFPADFCAHNNGGCDYHVTCDVFAGNRTCGLCPNGTTGTGETTCISLCGNEQCEPDVNEDCVTCPQDCMEQHCGVCGDGECDSKETCKNCSQDCKSCDKEICDPACKYGKCSEGVCVCTGSWAGPSCDSDSDTLSIITNSSVPVVTVVPSSTTKTNFSIGLHSIAEYDSNETIVYGFMVSELSFNYSVDALGFNYSTALVNGAKFSMTVQYFQNAQSKTNSLKVGIVISTWPFQALSHSLNIMFKSPIGEFPEEGDSPCFHNSKDIASLRWQYVNIHNVALYVRFETTATLDGRTRNINYKLNGTDHSVTAVLQHFWDSARMDQEYGVLLNDKLCTKHSSTLYMLIVVIVVPLVSCIIISLVIWWVILPKWRERRQVRGGNDAIAMRRVKISALPVT